MVLLVGISGSPRRGGNTELLLDAALEGARAAGAEVRKVVLAELDFSGCLSCGRCDPDGRCPIEDDMASLYPLLERSDAVILASPIYFDGLTSQAKALIDRGQAFWVRKYRLKQCGKKKLGALLSTAARIGTDFACAERTARTYFLTIDAKFFDSLTYPGFEESGSIADHPCALGEARKLGGRMVREMDQGAL